MPACFQLTRKGDTEPSRFCDLDEAICQHLGVNADPVKYIYGWYDTVGLRLALGYSFNTIIDNLKEVGAWELVAIAAYLNEHYISNAWHER